MSKFKSIDLTQDDTRNIFTKDHSLAHKYTSSLSPTITETHQNKSFDKR